MRRTLVVCCGLNLWKVSPYRVNQGDWNQFFLWQFSICTFQHSIDRSNNGLPISSQCHNDKFGTHHCMLATREALMRKLHIKVEDSIIENA